MMSVPNDLRVKLSAVVLWVLLVSVAVVAAPAPAGASTGCVIDGTAVVTQAFQSDCDALIAVYDATNGPGWGAAQEWNTATDPCSWTGVECGLSGGVTRLNLQDMDMSGSLPDAIGDFLSLTSLRIYYQPNMSGSLPASVGQLQTLTSFVVFGVPFTGEIPAELFTVGELWTLWIDRTEMSGSIPAEIKNLPKLQTLLFCATVTSRERSRWS